MVQHPMLIPLSTNAVVPRKTDPTEKANGLTSLYHFLACVVSKTCHFSAFVDSRISHFLTYAKNKFVISWRLPRTCKQRHFLPFAENT